MKKKRVWGILVICIIIVMAILIIPALIHEPYIPPEQQESIPPPPRSIATVIAYWREGKEEDYETVLIYDRNVKTGEVVYVNETVNFRSYSEGIIDNYEWKIQTDLGLITHRNSEPDIVYATEGQYGFTLTVSNKGGSDSFSGSFDVISG